MIGAQLTDNEFKKFSDLIYKQTGIFLKSEKKELLNARLGKRLRICRIDSFKSYFKFISSPEQRDFEFIHFLDSVSTNFTSFFREISHFEYLKAEVLPKLFAGARGRELFLWSSASSSGEEPYTLAMVLNDFSQTNPGFRFKVLATDISTKVLNMANKGIYSIEQTSKMPKESLKKYFQKGVGKSAGMVKVKGSLSKQVSFERFNLMQDFPWHSEMDVIFCRILKFCFGMCMFVFHYKFSVTSSTIISRTMYCN